MNPRTSRLPLYLALAGIFLATNAVGGGKKKPGKTHLAVPVNHIVHVETFSVDNDNTGGHGFFYDRGSNSPFLVPDGFSFVVTDVFVEPESVGVNDSRYYLAVIGLAPGEARSFTARFGGTATYHAAFSGGMVIPGGTQPTARNTTFSSTDIGVRMLGYFVEGDGLPPDTAPF